MKPYCIDVIDIDDQGLENFIYDILDDAYYKGQFSSMEDLIIWIINQIDNYYDSLYEDE